MITQDNYLDVGNLLINEIVGSAVLFSILGLIFIAYLGVKNRLPVQVTMILMFLFVGLTMSYVYNSFVWIVAVFIVGLIIYMLWAKVWKR